MDAGGDHASSVPQGEPGGGSATKQGGGGETGATTSEVLLQEATKLLKLLRAPQLRMIKVSQLDYDNSSMMVLLDSGATHALRPANSMEEWEAASPTQVSLADGVTTKLRLKPTSKVLLSSPEEDDSKQSWIIPTGVTELGYKFGWKGARRWLCDDRGRDVDVTIQQGCPMVSKDVGKELINKLEIRQVQLAMKAMLVNALFADPKSMTVASLQNGTELALTVKLKALFPALPDDILMRVIPDMTNMRDGIDGHLLPWNRGKRNLANAKQVVVHLFSLGGPPCRTVSALQYQDDGGPNIPMVFQRCQKPSVSWLWAIAFCSFACWPCICVM